MGRQLEPEGGSLATVPRSIFSVAGLRGPERFEAWKDSISSIFDVEAERDIVAHFDAQLEATLIGPLLFVRTQTRGQAWTRSTRRMATDGMDHYLIQFYEKGRHLDVEGAQGTEGYVVVFDLSRPMANTTTDLCNYSLLVPRLLLAPQLERPDEMHSLVAKGVAGSLLRSHMMTLHALSTSIDVASAGRVADATVALVAACLNGSEADGGLRDGATSFAGLMQIKRYIDAQLHSGTLTTELIARENGVSRSKLYMMFECYGGVAAYIRDRRLQYAFQVLRDPNCRHRSLYDIALEAGYNNDAAFCRAFKNKFDFTPGEIRRHRRIPYRGESTAINPGRRYEQWLHDLGSQA